MGGTGSAALQPGLHELLPRQPEGRPALDLDRWLLTRRGDFPLLRERPHAW